MAFSRSNGCSPDEQEYGEEEDRHHGKALRREQKRLDRSGQHRRGDHGQPHTQQVTWADVLPYAPINPEKEERGIGRTGCDRERAHEPVQPGFVQGKPAPAPDRQVVGDAGQKEIQCDLEQPAAVGQRL